MEIILYDNRGRGRPDTKLHLSLGRGEEKESGPVTSSVTMIEARRRRGNYWCFYTSKKTRKAMRRNFRRIE